MKFTTKMLVVEGKGGEGGGGEVIQLFNAKFSPNYVFFHLYKRNESKTYYTSLKICCNIFLKFVQLVICINVLINVV
jgi:hypothetical protein